MGITTYRFIDGKCERCGTAAVNALDGKPACPRCDPSHVAPSTRPRAGTGDPEAMRRIQSIVAAHANDQTPPTGTRVPQTMNEQRDTFRRKQRAQILADHLSRNSHPPDFPRDGELDALERVFDRARGCSGGESRCRQFLLAWQSHRTYGGWDPTDLWCLDDNWRADLLTVINMIARGPGGFHASHYGYEREMQALIEQYRPGDYESHECHKCAANVGHVCDAEGHQRRLREDREEREREERRERFRRDKPYGACPKCERAIETRGAALCEWCA